MADRYWVGGSGTWDSSSTANWSTTSGGAAGASAPTSADIAWFDANSGAGTVSVVSGAAANGFILQNVDTVLDFQTDLSMGAGGSVLAGTFNLNTHTLTCRTFDCSSSSVRTLDFGTGKVVLTGNNATMFNCSTSTNLNAVGGTRRFELSYTGSSGTRTINCGANVQTQNAFDFFVLGGTDSVRFQASGRVRNVDLTGFAGTLVDNGALSFFGSLVIPAGVTYAGGTNLLTFFGASTTGTIACGITIDHPITINGAGLNRTLGANLVMGATRALTLTNGTFDAAGYSVTVGNFALGSGTKTLTLGSGTWTVAGTSWDANTNVTNLTVSPSTGVISMTSASAKTFAGGGKAWPTLNQGGAGTLTIQQANTFANITNTVQPATITFPASTTTTVGIFKASGIPAGQITLNSSTAATQATISTLDSRPVTASYVSIQDIAATGKSDWYADTGRGAVDLSNNTGWQFIPLAVRQVIRGVMRSIIRPIMYPDLV